MRVALISAYYPSHGGGIELACADLAQVLQDAGIEVVWIAQRDGTKSNERPALYSPVAGTDMVYELSGIPMPLPMPWAALRMSREIGRADLVIVAEANFALSALAYWIARFRRKTVVVVQHVGKPATLSRLARGVMTLGEKWIVRPIVRGADAVVCVSPVVANHFSDLRTKRRLLTIGHGIDTVRFRPSRNTAERQQDRHDLGLPQTRNLVCYLGRLTESKGLLVVREMARVRPDWSFAIAGSGPIDPAEWGLANVYPLGQLDRQDAAKLLRASQAMVLPSPSESFSLVVREALASGCHAICSEQVLQTDPGLAPYLLTRPVDLARCAETAAEFASALDRLPDFAIGEVRDYIERTCSPAAMGAQYLRLVDDLAASAGGRGP
jgi:glycosyltransferase involved in cell wall biosynthesis